MSRQLIIDEIVTQLKTITALNDNVVDFGMNWEQDELPAISVFDSTVDHQLVNDEPEAFSQMNRMRITLSVFVKGTTRASSLRSLVKDIWGVIGANKYWDNLAAFTRPISTTTNVDDRGIEKSSLEIIGAELVFEVGVNSDAFDF